MATTQSDDANVRYSARQLFEQIDAKLERMADKFDTTHTRLAAIETRLALSESRNQRTEDLERDVSKLKDEWTEHTSLATGAGDHTRWLVAILSLLVSAVVAFAEAARYVSGH